MICIGCAIRVSIIYNTWVSIDAVSAAVDTHIVDNISTGEKEMKKSICEKLTNEWILVQILYKNSFGNMIIQPQYYTKR